MKRLFSTLFLLLPLVSPAQTIYRYAGNYINGYNGDGGYSALADLYHPSGVFADNSGNVYIADFGNNVIRKVNASGFISTIAGNTTTGYSGDGGPATSAALYHPTNIATDNAGNLYIADAFNNVIRKVNTAGIITTVAGSVVPGYTGDRGPATAARLDNPNDVKVDNNGNLYIADSHNNVVRMVNTSGIITTFAGNGYLYGTGSGGYAGDGGLAIDAKLYYPEGLAIDNSGNVFVAEEYNNIIREINTSGVISTVAGNDSAGNGGDTGPATAAELHYPYSVAFDAVGNLYIADYGNNVIRTVSKSGIINNFAGCGIPGAAGDGGVALNAEFNSPLSLSVDNQGNVYVADFANNVVRVISETVSSVKTVSLSNEFTLYPNPASTELNISAPNKITDVAICNLVGQTVYTYAQNSENVQINTAGLSPGVYFIKINGIEVRKFVKE